jgi:hypothetical protein
MDTFGKRRIKSRKSLAILSVSLLMLVLTACGQYTPTGTSRAFLINEVFPGSGSGLQWVEIINYGEPAPLSGWTLVTQRGSVNLGTLRGTAVAGTQLVTLNANTPVPTNAQIIVASNPTLFKSSYSSLAANFIALDGSSVLGGLNPKGDAIVLRSGNDIIDQVGWGDNTTARQTLGITNNVNLEVATPDDNKSIGRTPAVGRPDPDNPGYFTIHNSVFPASGVPQPRDRYVSNFFISTLTDWIGIIGGLMLWLVFVMVALIARRFQELAQQKTFWEYLLIAPIGVLIYAGVTMWAFSFTSSRSYGEIPEWRNLAFIALFISGIACLYVVNIFRLIAKNILEAE